MLRNAPVYAYPPDNQLDIMGKQGIGLCLVLENFYFLALLHIFTTFRLAHWMIYNSSITVWEAMSILETLMGEDHLS